MKGREEGRVVERGRGKKVKVEVRSWRGWKGWNRGERGSRHLEV